MTPEDFKAMDKRIARATFVQRISVAIAFTALGVCVGHCLSLF